MPNLDSLSNLSNSARALSNLIVVSPSSTGSYQAQISDTEGLVASVKRNLTQPAKLLFHYEGEQSITLESDITDHFIEDNTAVQDQIALKPERVTVKGYIGELNDVPPFAPEAFKFIRDKLIALTPLTPELTQTGLQAYNTAFSAYQTAASAAVAGVSAWSTIQNHDPNAGLLGTANLAGQLSRNKQQVMYQTLYGYWRKRTLFTVQTPWTIYKDMAIQSLRAVQDADTRMITDFEITFKMIRTASTILDKLVNLGRAETQAAETQDNGTNSPSPTETNFDDELQKMTGS